MNLCCFSYDLYDDTTKTRAICSPKLIAISARLEKNQRANQITRMRNSIISLDKGNRSDRGYNCEAKLSREHF